MASVPISALYLPGVVVHASRAAALKIHPDLADYTTDQPPKNWEYALLPTDNPDDVFPVHNLHLGVPSPIWSLTYLTKGQAATLNIPPDVSGPNPIVYPASVPIPMTYPLPANITVLATPFGIQVSDSSAGPAVPVDPTLANILTTVQRIDKNTTPKV